ncbi:MAG TPA: Asp-tRNA(Asn)/Glu-tRNA(Gln) amidotransferase subunit GatC [Dissulfurispiraceae bacterium]|nr:Asp-tRNA(Asn)/Glu-tRNA(Gln) amidotransferase subunit GatC [Dissulfurispiraceae bacterium]
MKLSLEEVRHIAQLSRLSITDEELELYAPQLSKIIDYVEQLNNLDTSDIEPTSNIIALNNVMADDVLGMCLPRDEALRNAPDSTEKFYRIPKIIE